MTLRSMMTSSVTRTGTVTTATTLSATARKTTRTKMPNFICWEYGDLAGHEKRISNIFNHKYAAERYVLGYFDDCSDGDDFLICVREEVDEAECRVFQVSLDIPRPSARTVDVTADYNYDQDGNPCCGIADD